MNKKILFILLITTLMITSFSYGEVTNEIVAVVNDDVITKQDLDKFFLPLKLQLKSRYSGRELEEKLNKARDNLLNKMIQDKLLLEKAKKRNLAVNEVAVKEKLNRIKENFSSQEEFQKYLDKSKMKISDLKQRYRQQFLIHKLVSKEIKSNIRVNPNELLQYYEKNKHRFKNPKRVKVRQIFIPNETKNASKKINNIKKLLNERGSFREVARKYSKGTNAEQGGLLGIREKGELMHKIDKVIFDLKEGQISDVVETSMGYHIFKVEKKYSFSTREFKEVRNKIKNILFQKKVKEKFQKYLEGIKEDAYVSIKKERKDSRNYLR